MQNNKLKKFLGSETTGAQITKVALAVLIVAGAVTLFAMAPGLTYVAKPFLNKKKSYTSKQWYGAVKNLEKGKFIKVHYLTGGQVKITITKKGYASGKKIAFDITSIKQQKHWDKKWRIVVFDIPADKKYNSGRNSLRAKLKHLDFYQLQKSVWVHPYPCEEEIFFIADFFHLEQFVNIAVAEEIINDTELRKHFSL